MVRKHQASTLRKPLKKLSSDEPVTFGDKNHTCRRSVYIEELGEPEHIFPDTEPEAIEILAFSRDFSTTDSKDEGYVLLTNGMSDRRMVLASEPDGDVKHRAELMWYVREPTTEIVENMRFLAEYPFIDETWLGFGHRIPMPEAPISEAEFRTYLFLTPIIKSDQHLADALSVEGDEVEILTVNLISDTEYLSIKTDGLGAFLDMLDYCKYPAIFDPKRGSYV